MNQEGKVSQPTSPVGKFDRFVDACIPEAVRADSSQALQARTLIIFVLILSFFSIVGMTFTLMVEQSLPWERVLTMFLIALQPVSLLIMWKKQHLRGAALFFLALSLILVCYVDFMNRSLEGPASVLWVLPYAMAAMLVGARSAFYIALASVVLISLNATLLKLDLLPASLSSPENWIWLKLIFTLIVLCTVAFCIYGLISLEKRKQEELSQEIRLNNKMMESLEVATNEAQAAARSKELFLATMSHELRTPLNGVLGNAQLLAKEIKDISAKARVENITSSGELLLSIINDVLDFSKFESQGVSLNLEVFDLSQCLRQLYRLIKPRVQEGVQFSISGADEPIFINTDPNRLSQVILNLLSNAAKFTEQGHIGLSMSMLGDGQLKIQVSDTGNGISEENQKRLFQDFVQVGDDTQKHMEGTGLGLAITRRIVERMEGDIQVYSSLGKGTTMAVYLPVELVEEPQTDQDPDIASNSLNDVDYSAVRVLIVDDVEMNCVMLEALLNSLGISNCEVERDGLDAVNRIKQDDNFDILLMDVRMPIMNGLDATRQIRELGYDKPVIAVTANAFEEDQEGCLEAGMEHFLAKPLRLEDLQSVLNKALASTNPSLN